MADRSSEHVLEVPTVEDIAEQGEWQSELHSLQVVVLFYNLVLLAQFSDNDVRAGVDLRWQRVFQDWFCTAHRNGLLVNAVGASYLSSREDRLADPLLQVQAIWIDSLNGVYGEHDVAPCDHCAGCGRWICPLCMRAFLCTECGESNTHCSACSSLRSA